jgi:hypothetical protein
VPDEKTISHTFHISKIYKLRNSFYGLSGPPSSPSPLPRLLHCVRQVLDTTQRRQGLYLAMPASLRRTFSSPSVRPSPYPTSNSNVGSGRVHGNRRSSGSETSNRRVLADLEWWRVVDGQHDTEAEQETVEREQDQGQDGEAPSGNSQSLVEDAGVERPSTPLAWTFENSADLDVRALTVALSLSAWLTFLCVTHQGLPTSQFAALSIAPRTPPRLARRHTHSLEWSPSSLESTPEAIERPIECIRFAMLDSDIGFADADAPPALPPFSLACTLAGPPFPICTHSFDFSALLNDSAGRFADIGVASCDQNVFN